MVFYKGEENERKFEQTKAKLETVETDVVDSLKKMAFHVVTPDFNKYAEAEAQTVYNEESDIEEKIDRSSSEKLLEGWKRLVVGRRLELNYDNEKELDDDQIEYLKEQLFVEFGQDVGDVWVSFRHYKLDPTVSAKDMEKYMGL